MKAKKLTSTGISIQEILNFLEGLHGPVEVMGDKNASVFEAVPCDYSEADFGSLAFIRSKDAVHICKTMQDSKAGVFLISKKAAAFDAPQGKIVIRVPEPHLAFVELQQKFFIDEEKEFYPTGIHQSSVIDPSAKIGRNVLIGPYVVIGADVSIGDNTVIHPHVVIYHNVKIGEAVVIHAHSVVREHCSVGDRVIVQPGAVIGADGFGYTVDPKIGLRQVPQLGEVQIGSRVEVGANTCIDRATFGKTCIRDGSKVDNLVQIGHNVEIGSNSLICGQVGIGGSSKIEDSVVLGGKVGVADHQVVSKGVRVGGGGIVITNLLKAGDYIGYPAQPAFFWRRIMAAQYSLPEMLKVFRRNKTDGAESEKIED